MCAPHGKVGAGASHWSALTPILLGGLALRFAHLVQAWPVLVTNPPPEQMDRWLNMLVAQTIANGDLLGGWAAPYDSSPGYSYLLAALYRLSAGAWTPAIVVQLLCGSLVPLFMYDVGSRLRDAATGIVAALLAAFYVPAIFYEGLLVKFSLIPFAMAGLMSGFVRLRDCEAWAAPQAGFFAGLLILLRPNAALVVALGTWWALVGRPRQGIARGLMGVLLGAAVCLGPMAARDGIAAYYGRGSALGGIHFYIGANPLADGEYVVIPGVRPDIIGHVVDAKVEAERRTGRTLSPDEVSRYWFQEGVAFIRDQPSRWLLLTMRKLWFAFAASEAGSFGDDFDELRSLSGVLALPAVTFGTLTPLALLGLLSCVRRREAFLPAISAGCLAGILPFFVAGRYRLMLATPLLLAAAIGLVALVALWRRRGTVRAALVLPGLLLIAAALGASDMQVLGLCGTVGIASTCVVLLDEPLRSVHDVA